MRNCNLQAVCDLVVTVLMLTCNFASVAAGFHEQNYVGNYVCGKLDDLISNQCTTSQIARSKIECASLCFQKNTTCIGSVFDGQNTVCYFIHLCDYVSDNTNCDMSSDTVEVLRKQCQNGGTFTTERGVVCRCYRGYIGDYCERLATHCKEVYGFGYPIGVTRAVWIDDRNLVQKMVCSAALNYYSIGLFANSGKSNHNLTFNDYRDGYYINENNFFLGLENMHHLLEPSNPKAVVKLVLQFQNESTLLRDYVYYHGFGVLGEAESYSYLYSFSALENSPDDYGIETSVENCLTNDLAIPFSTPDVDNDFDPGNNCAAAAGAGWWFTDCGAIPDCNPLGLSVTVLPSPATNAHVAFKGLDMINPPWGPIFKKVVATLVVEKNEKI